ncbi:hypothetical protein RHSIM_Rhsim10G0135900 [Rhododendron simsii]|uniref:Uncharacterized protein n=1 Tax=Rhododendron simsii TaxID=118357 RepID=A0A834GCR7_RHOSS|nr:hypothetical protein RHSIM_Rhsim10G0135900 [Rhododendron simsii]
MVAEPGGCGGDWVGSECMGRSSPPSTSGSGTVNFVNGFNEKGRSWERAMAPPFKGKRHHGSPQAIQDGQNQMIAAMTALTEVITAALLEAPMVPPAVPPLIAQSPPTGEVANPAVANPVQNPLVAEPTPVTGIGSVHQQPLLAENNGHPNDMREHRYLEHERAVHMAACYNFFAEEDEYTDEEVCMTSYYDHLDEIASHE